MPITAVIEMIFKRLADVLEHAFEYCVKASRLVSTCLEVPGVRLGDTLRRLPRGVSEYLAVGCQLSLASSKAYGVHRSPVCSIFIGNPDC